MLALFEAASQGDEQDDIEKADSQHGAPCDRDDEEQSLPGCWQLGHRRWTYVDLGGCSSGDLNNSLTSRPVSVCRPLRLATSRTAPGRSNLACARSRLASLANRSSRDSVSLIRLRSVLLRPSDFGRQPGGKPRVPKVPIFGGSLKSWSGPKLRSETGR